MKEKEKVPSTKEAKEIQSAYSSKPLENGLYWTQNIQVTSPSYAAVVHVCVKINFLFIGKRFITVDSIL